MLKFILVLVGAGAVVAVASIFWGRFTSAPKPAALVEVARVLGVTDSEPVEPINITEAAMSVAGSVAGAITNRVETAVASQALVAVARQYDQLPEDQRKALETIICQPAGQAQ